MFWYILLGISIGLTVFFIIKKCLDKDEDNFWEAGILGFGALALLIIAIAIGFSIRHKNDIATFERTKQYIEDVVPTLPESDNYAITTSKIEMNKWLYEIQYRYKNYHFWNFVPKEVMELEEIK